MKNYVILIVLISFSTFFVSCSDDNEINILVNEDETIVLEDSQAPNPIASQGFYIVNEDWFGHDKGTVNYFKHDGSIVYRAYRQANSVETLGTSTQFATTYGNNIFFVSKQGNRLVVANANTLNKKASFENIGGGDGRSFLGISTTKGYLGTSKDVRIFDIEALNVGDAVEGISGQVGNMCLVGNYAFALVQAKGVYIINTNTHKVEKLVEGSFNTLTQSKDGNVWIGVGARLIKLNPYSFETTEVTLSGTQIGSSWGAWNAGSLCASTQNNVLYWSNGAKITKYDIDTNSIIADFYSLPNDNDGLQQAFYGAGLRVDPLTDKLILSTKKAGWGQSGKYNWVHIVKSDGTLEKTILVKGGDGTAGTEGDDYFWFPAMPFFEDVNSPVILMNQIILKPNERKAICLSDKVVDADNMSTTMSKKIHFSEENKLVQYELKQDSLVIISSATKGKSSFTLHVNSNGKTTEKEIRVDVR